MPDSPDTLYRNGKAVARMKGTHVPSILGSYASLQGRLFHKKVRCEVLKGDPELVTLAPSPFA